MHERITCIGTSSISTAYAQKLVNAFHACMGITQMYLCFVNYYENRLRKNLLKKFLRQTFYTSYSVMFDLLISYFLHLEKSVSASCHQVLGRSGLFPSTNPLKETRQGTLLIADPPLAKGASKKIPHTGDKASLDRCG